MAQHKDLTGAELHEPKGVETATSGQVYVANGTGSGAWTDKNSDNLFFNKYQIQNRFNDISNAESVWFYIPRKSKMTRLVVILHGPVTAANSVLTIYINGVLFADTLTVTEAGSTAGSKYTLTIGTVHSINADSTVEIRSDGGSSTTALATVSLELEAIN